MAKKNLSLTYKFEIFSTNSSSYSTKKSVLHKMKTYFTIKRMGKVLRDLCGNNSVLYRLSIILQIKDWLNLFKGCSWPSIYVKILRMAGKKECNATLFILHCMYINVNLGNALSKLLNRNKKDNLSKNFFWVTNLAGDMPGKAKWNQGQKYRKLRVYDT